MVSVCKALYSVSISDNIAFINLIVPVTQADLLINVPAKREGLTNLETQHIPQTVIISQEIMSYETMHHIYNYSFDKFHQRAKLGAH